MTTIHKKENNRCDGKRCVVVVKNKRACLAKSKINSYTLAFVCTLPRGHDGDHIACCYDKHDIHRWENKKGSAK